MSDADTIEQVEQAPEPEVKETKRASREDYDRIQREKASKSGWKDFDEYVEEGGDPEKWKTADAFNTYGELIGTVKKQKQDFDQRLQGVQQLAEARIQAEREKLLSERKEAIKSGEVDQVESIEKQLNNLNQPIQSGPDPYLAEWNANNPWIMEDSPKADRAYKVFNTAIQQKKSVVEAVAMVEADIAKHFPSQPRKQATIPENERGKQSVGFGKTTKTLTMADLNDDEKLTWKHFSHAWGDDEKKFLQAASDLRKAANGGK